MDKPKRQNPVADILSQHALVADPVECEMFERGADEIERLEADLARLQARVGELEEVARDSLAFIGVMFGDADGTVPTTVRTPLGIQVELRALVELIRAALRPEEPQ